MLYAVIAGCETAFWVLLLTGLALRYRWRRRTLSTVVLACLPLVDLVLLVAATLDLRRGATPHAAHGLAAVFLGVSVVWGGDLVRWADARFAARVTAVATVSRAPRTGAAHARHQRREWARHLLAWAIGCGLLLAAAAMVGEPERAGPLLAFVRGWTLVLAIDFFWSFSYTLWPRASSGFPERPGGGDRLEAVVDGLRKHQQPGVRQ